MHWLRLLLFPFSLLFKWVTSLRNHLYDIGHKRSFQFEVPVVSVGNLNVGGSGKTPLVEYLIRLLSTTHQVATLSRGYGRRTRGLRIATPADSPETVGDESFLYHRNFGDRVKVVVAEERAIAIPEILHAHPEVNCILLDDAFQHRSVKPHLNILVTRYDRPFYVDHVMPVGYLRESRHGAQRADAIVVTKCPANISDDEVSSINARIRRYALAPVFFASIRYGQPCPFAETKSVPIHRVVLVTGIANHGPFVVYAKKNFQVLKHFAFKDHYQFKQNQLEQVANYVRRKGEDVVLLTTEKDSVRLAPLCKAMKLPVHCFFLPIEMQFCENGSGFDALVKRVVENNEAIPEPK